MKHSLSSLPPHAFCDHFYWCYGAIVTLGHLPAYKLAGFSVKGIYDVDRQKGVDVAKKWQIPKVYDTINIAVPSKQIVPIPKLLSINSHVLIQKPMGENLSILSRLLIYVKNVIFMVQSIFNFVMLLIFLHLKRLSVVVC
jgi:predicted dehydrogenase